MIPTPFGRMILQDCLTQFENEIPPGGRSSQLARELGNSEHIILEQRHILCTGIDIIDRLPEVQSHRTRSGACFWFQISILLKWKLVTA
jgi:hypothetical protein